MRKYVVAPSWVRGRMEQRRAALGLVAMVAVLSGCDRSGLNLAPVEGVVTYKGAPVPKAGVLFKPEKGPMGFGTTDEQGHFTLTTANRSGALVGAHRVAISKSQQLATPVPGKRFPRYETKNLIPAKYASPDTSGLSATVERGSNQKDFKLD